MWLRSLTLLLVAFIGLRPVTAQSPAPTSEEGRRRADARLHPAPISPVSPGELEAAIARGVEYLCRSQNRDGSWGSPRWTGGVDRDPVPGASPSFAAATTALCLEGCSAPAMRPR